MEGNRPTRPCLLLALETPGRLLEADREQALVRLLATLLAQVATSKPGEAGEHDDPDHA